MTLIKMSKQISEQEHYEELGFVYLWFDWKESDELIRMIERITKANPKTVRIIDMRDDCYHVVFANVPFTLKEARRYIAFYLREGKENMKGGEKSVKDKKELSQS